MASEKSLPSSIALDENGVDRAFTTYNQHVAAEMNAERHRLINSFLRARADRIYSDALTPAQIRQMAQAPSTFTVGSLASTLPPTPGLKSTAAQRARFAGLVAAATTFALHIADVMAAPAERRTQAWWDLAKQIAGAAAVAGMAGALSKKLEDHLKNNTESILKSLFTAKNAKSVGTKLEKSASAVSAAGAAAFAAGLLALESLWHCLWSLWASEITGDIETSKIEWQKAKDQFSIDNLCRIIVSSVAGYTISTMLPAAVIGTGFLSVALPMFLFVVTTCITEAVLCRKNKQDGWANWISSFFVADRRAKVWVGETFSEYEGLITSELQCSISHEIVVDPVRSIRTGCLFERAMIYEWLANSGTDPLTRESATRLDYIDSPCAERHATKIARYLGATSIGQSM